MDHIGVNKDVTLTAIIGYNEKKLKDNMQIDRKVQTTTYIFYKLQFYDIWSAYYCSSFHFF